MAKKDDFDLDMFDDWDSEFDPNSIKTKQYNTDSDRSPVTKVAALFKTGLKSGAASATSKLNSAVDTNFYKTTSVVDESFRVMSEVERMRTELMKDATPIMNQTKRVATKFLPKAKPFVPDSLYKRIEKKLKEGQEEHRSEAADKKQSQDAAIENVLGTVFAENQLVEEERRDTDKKEEKIEKYIDRTLDASRHKDLLKALHEMKSPMLHMGNFFKTTYPAYLKESLKLQFKHYFVAQDSLASQQVMAKMLETKLEEIRQNTALPDTQKRTKMEAIKQQTADKLGQRISGKLYGWADQIIENIKTQVYQPLKDGLSGFGDNLEMLDSVGDMEEMLNEFGGGEPEKKAGDYIAGWIGSAVGRTAAGKQLSKFTKKYGSHISSIEQLAANAKMKAALKIRDSVGTSDSDLINAGLSIMNPNIRSNAGTASNKLFKDPTELAKFDNVVRSTIVEVIPGALMKIHQAIVSGFSGTQADELMYDFKTRDFTTVTKFRQDAMTEMFGNAKDNSKHLGEGLGVLRAAAVHHGTVRSSQFDLLSKDITKVIGNHSIELQDPNPEEIRNVSLTGKLETKYQKKVFNGVKDPAAVASMLCHSLFLPDGVTVDRQAAGRFTNYIVSSMDKDDYLEKFPVMAEAFGYARHLSDLLHAPDSEGKRVFKTEEVHKHRFGNIDRKTLKQTIDSETKYGTLAMDNFAVDTEEGTIPKWVSRLMTRTMGGTMSKEDMAKRQHKNISNAKLGQFGIDANEYSPEVLSGGGYKTTNGLSSKLPDVMQVEIIKQPISVIIEEIRTKNKKGLTTTAATDSTEKGVVGAVNQFEQTFIKYQDSQKSMTDVMTTHLKDISGNILNLNLTLPNLDFSGMRDGATKKMSRLGTLWSGGKAIVGDSFRTTADMTKSYYNRLKKVGSGTLDRVKGAGSGLLELISNYGPGLVGAAGTFGSTMMKMPFKPLSWMTSKIGKLANKLKMEPFVDIYLKGNIEIGKPLLSKVLQQQGVIFVDGKPVTTSYEINKIVLDPKDNSVLITEEHLKTGLVTADGSELSNGKAFFKGLVNTHGGKVMDGVRRLGGGIRDIATNGIGGIAEIYAKMFGLGTDALRGVGKFGGKLMNKLFGLSSESNFEKPLKTHVGDKLDLIYQLLKKTIGKGIDVEDDTDGDGLREGSWQDKDKNKAEAGKLAGVSTFAGLVRLLGKRTGDKVKDRLGKEDDSEGGSGLSMSDMVKMWVANKFMKTRAGKAILSVGQKALSKIGLGALVTGAGTTVAAGASAISGGAIAAAGAGLEVAGAAGATIKSSKLAATAGTAAGAAVASGKLSNLVTKFVGLLPAKFQKFIKPEIVASRLAKAGPVATSKLLGKFAGPIGWGIAATTASYAAYNSFRNAASLLGCSEESLSVPDKLKVGCAGALADALFLDSIFGYSIKEIATDWLGVTPSVKTKTTEDSKWGEIQYDGISHGLGETKDDKKDKLEATPAKGITALTDPNLRKSATTSSLKWDTVPGIFDPSVLSTYMYDISTDSGWDEAFQTLRAKAYGIDLKQSYSMWSTTSSIMLKLEKQIDELLRDPNKSLSGSDMEKLAGRFNLNDSKAAVDFWSTWFYQRFMPAFKIFLNILKDKGCTYSNYKYKFTRETSVDLLSAFDNATKAKAAELSKLAPTEKAFQEFKNELNKVKREEESGGKGVSSRSKVETVTAHLDTKNRLGRDNTYLPKPEMTEAANRMNNVDTSKEYSLPVAVSQSVYREDLATPIDPKAVSQGASGGAKLARGSAVNMTAGIGGSINDIPTPSGNGSWESLSETIVAAARMAGVDPGFMATMAAMESGFNALATNKSSSAGGLYQFIDSTWAMMINKYGAKYGIEPGTPKTDPRANALMAAEYTKENQKILETKLKRKATDTELYLAHFLGAGGAAAVLNGKPTDIAAQLNPRAAAANRSIFYKADGAARTLQEVYDLLDKRLSTSRGQYGTKARMLQSKINNGSKNPSSSGISLSDNMSVGSNPSSSTSGSTTGATNVSLPTDSNIVTSPYGPRNVEGGSKDHKGIDLRAPAGAPIKSMASGIVAGVDNTWGMSMIDHGNGLSSKYLHQSTIEVRPGQEVSSGQEIGTSGGKGPAGDNQYTPHLHFEVNKNNQQVNPESFLQNMGLSTVRKGDAKPLSDVNLNPKLSSADGGSTPLSYDGYKSSSTPNDTRQSKSSGNNSFNDKLDTLIEVITTGFSEGKALVDIKNAIDKIQMNTGSPDGSSGQNQAAYNTPNNGANRPNQYKATSNGVVAPVTRTTTEA